MWMRILPWAPAPIVLALWLRPCPSPILELPVVVARSEWRTCEFTSNQIGLHHEALDRHEELMHAFSVAEVLENDMPHEAQARLDELRSIVQTLAQTDESVVRAMRDRYVREVIAWLPRPSSQNRLQRVGNIAAQFTRLFAVEEGRIVAPTSVVRAFIAARWNSIHGIDFTEGMSDDGKRAYFGWIALHAESMSSGERIDALTRYGSLAGPRALEAAAALYFEANRLDLALPAMEAAFQASGNTRLRNHALALAEIAAAPDRHAPGELPVHGP